jgi:hypothetical protein
MKNFFVTQFQPSRFRAVGKVTDFLSRCPAAPDIFLFLSFFFDIQMFFYTIMKLFITLLENVNKSRTIANACLQFTINERNTCSTVSFYAIPRCFQQTQSQQHDFLLFLKAVSTPRFVQVVRGGVSSHLLA